MKNYLKQDMIFKDYKWIENDFNLDNTEFNRNNGYHLLYIINETAVQSNISDKNILEIIECLIHDYLPIYIQNRKDVFDWIEESLFKRDYSLFQSMHKIQTPNMPGVHH